MEEEKKGAPLQINIDTGSEESSPSKKRDKDKMTSLQKAKQIRLQVENDAKILANRIALLKKEQEKTKKKTKDTIAMSQNVMSKKLSLEEKQLNKEREKEEEMKRQHNSQKESQQLYLQRKQNIKNLKKNIAKEKLAEAQQIKEESRRNDLRKQEIEEQITAKNQAKKNLVNLHEQKGAKKVKKFLNEKQKNFKNNYEERVKAEHDMISKKEQELAEMERMEKELINHLQNSQATQKDAFGELQKALKYQSPKRNNQANCSSTMGSFFSAKESSKRLEQTPQYPYYFQY